MLQYLTMFTKKFKYYFSAGIFLITNFWMAIAQAEDARPQGVSIGQASSNLMVPVSAFTSILYTICYVNLFYFG